MAAGTDGEVYASGQSGILMPRVGIVFLHFAGLELVA